MLVRDVPREVLWGLHVGLQGQLGPEVIAYLAEGLEPDLAVDLGGADSLTIILTGMGDTGAIRRWREWLVPTANELATVCALRLRVECTLAGCREFDAWVERALQAIRAGDEVPLRMGRKWA